MKRTISALLLAASVIATRVSAIAHPNDFEGWFITNAHISLDANKTYQIFVEGQPRLGNDWQRLATFQGRAALVFNWDTSLGFYAGYGWTPQFYDSKYHRDYRDEQRIWQQVVYRHELFGIEWQHRIREEQRMQMRTSGISNRFRYQLRGSYALNQKKDFGLTGYDALMINLNGVTGGAWDGYDRNRIFFGPYWVIGPGHYEIGYLGEHLKRFGSDERWTNALLLSASYNF